VIVAGASLWSRRDEGVARLLPGGSAGTGERGLEALGRDAVVDQELNDDVRNEALSRRQTEQCSAAIDPNLRTARGAALERRLEDAAGSERSVLGMKAARHGGCE